MWPPSAGYGSYSPSASFLTKIPYPSPVPGPITTLTLLAPVCKIASPDYPRWVTSYFLRVQTPYPAAVKSLIKTKLSNLSYSAIACPSLVGQWEILTAETVLLQTGPAIPTTPSRG